MKEPAFKINPRFRLTTKHLSVVWHCVDKLTVECEAAIDIPDRFIYKDKTKVELLAQYHDGILDMIYHDSTDFETKKDTEMASRTYARHNTTSSKSYPHGKSKILGEHEGAAWHRRNRETPP